MVKRAKNAFAYMEPQENGPAVPRVINPGLLFDDDDPIVEKYADSFEDVETHVSNRKQQQRENVEAATAAPGERRTRSTPARSTRRKRTENNPEQLTEAEQAEQLRQADPDDPDNA